MLGKDFLEKKREIIYVNLEKHFQKMIFEPFESAIVCNKLLEGTLCDKLTLGRVSGIDAHSLAPSDINLKRHKSNLCELLFRSKYNSKMQHRSNSCVCYSECHF